MPRPIRSAAKGAASRPVPSRRRGRGARAGRGAAASIAAATVGGPGPEQGFAAHLSAAAEVAGPRANGELPLMESPAGPGGWQRLLPAGWRRFWPALRRSAAQMGRRPRRELRMAEMLTLSEKRFLAVVRYGETQFLIGGAQNSIALLSRIEPPGEAHPAMFR